MIILKILFKFCNNKIFLINMFSILKIEIEFYNNINTTGQTTSEMSKNSFLIYQNVSKKQKLHLK